LASRLIDKQLIFSGQKVRLEVHHMENDQGLRHRVEVVVHPGAVVILPIVNATTILMIRNRRHAIGRTLLELPAGTLERDEDPINCAGRELQEETGHLAGRLQSIGSFYSTPGIMTEKMYAYAAYDLQPTRMGLEPSEEIEVEQVAYEDAIEWTRTGQIADAKTIATLLLYDRFFRVAGS
jgi:ADP-ribose pyrophosphatase